MKVLVTGATGFIGTHVVKELLGAGHAVLGLARSETGADMLRQLGAEVHRGDLTDLDSLKDGAASSDGVIHLAFRHDFAGARSPDEFAKLYNDNCRIDREAITAMASALAGSNRPLVMTSGSLLLKGLGRPGTENDVEISGNMSVRGKSEELTRSLASKQVRTVVMRLPPTVHGDGDHGFVPGIIRASLEKKLAAYIGNGDNVWPAVHVKDAATVYRLAFEKGTAGATYHAFSEEGIPTKRIAQVIGEKLNIPVQSIPADQAYAHMGFIGNAFGEDNPVSSKLTREALGWKPAHRTLLEDLRDGTYFESSAIAGTRW